MSIPLREVPLALRRRAAQHLESLRGSELGRRAEGLTFGDTAWPLYRPDVDGIAYYELALVHAGVQPPPILTTRAWPMDRPPEIVGARPVPRSSASSGFVIVSTGPHDSPIPHWSLERAAPSHQLREAGGGREPGRIYKLDALSYVAEDAAGAAAARVGPAPVLPEGLPHDLTKLRGRISSLIASPPSPIEDDSKATGIEHRVALSPLIAELPRREQVILHLRFFEGLTQSEIANRLGISQMHVSRLLARSLAKLRGSAEEG